MDNLDPFDQEPALNVPPPRSGEQPTPPPEAHARRSKKGLLIGLVIGLGILLLAGGTYAAARFGYISLPFALPGMTNDVIAKSFDALYNSTASEATSEFSLKIAARDPAVPSLFPSLESTGDDITNGTDVGRAGALVELVPENISIVGSMTAYSEKTAGNGKADTSLMITADYNETKIEADVQFRLLEENVYVKINTLTGIPNIDATKVAGKWYTTTVSDVSALVPAEEQADDRQAAAEARQTLEQTLELAQKHQLFKTKKNFGTEMIGGTKTRHTSHVLNPEQVVPLVEALVELRKKNGQDVSQFATMLSTLKKPEATTLIENFAKTLTFDLWYDGKAKIMKKIAVTFIIAPPDGVEDLKDSQFVLNVSTTINSYGQTKAVETPAEAQPTDELITSLYSTETTLLDELSDTDETSSTNVAANNAQRKSDISQLNTALILFFDDNGAYPNELRALTPTYLTTSLTDPVTKAAYSYAACPPNHFLLGATLDGGAGYWYVDDQGGAKESTTIVACGTSLSNSSNSGTSESFILNTNAQITNTSSSLPDTDGDGLDDAAETVAYKTDPTKRDTDVDGISDFNEITLCGTSPLKADSDQDSYGDRDEIMNGYNPNGPGSTTYENSCRETVAQNLEVSNEGATQ